METHWRGRQGRCHRIEVGVDADIDCLPVAAVHCSSRAGCGERCGVGESVLREASWSLLPICDPPCEDAVLTYTAEPSACHAAMLMTAGVAAAPAVAAVART